MASDARLKIIIDALNLASDELAQVEGDLKGIEGASKKTSMSWTEFNSAISVGKQAIQAIAGAYDETIGKTIRWGDEVDNLTRITGTSAEESSRLGIVLGDLGIDLGRVKTAASALKEQGLTPSLATLRDLAVKYQSIDDAAERTEWGTKTLGKAYYDLAEVLSQPIERLDELTEAADKSGKVLGQDMLDATEELAIQSKQLGDRWDGLIMQLSSAVIPLMLKATENSKGLAVAYLNIKDPAQEAARSTLVYADAADRARQRSTELADATADAAAQFAEASANALKAGLSGAITQSHEKYTQAVGATRAELEKTQKELDKYTRMNGQSVAVVQDATVSQAEYQLSQIALAEAQQKLSETSADNTKEYLQAQVAVENASARVQDFSTQLGTSDTVTLNYTTKIADLSAKKAELQGKIQAAKDALVEETNQFLYQQLAIDGNAAANLELARKLGLIDEASYQASLKAQALKKQYEDGTLSADQYAEAARRLSNDIAGIPNRIVTIQVVTQGDVGQVRQDTSGGAAQNETRRAAGGPVTAGMPYIWNEAGKGEVLVPAGNGYVLTKSDAQAALRGAGSGGGGGITLAAGAIAIYQQPGQSAEQLADAVMVRIARKARGLAAGGAAYMGQ